MSCAKVMGRARLRMFFHTLPLEKSFFWSVSIPPSTDMRRSHQSCRQVNYIPIIHQLYHLNKPHQITGRACRIPQVRSVQSDKQLGLYPARLICPKAFHFVLLRIHVVHPPSAVLTIYRVAAVLHQQVGRERSVCPPDIALCCRRGTSSHHPVPAG